MLYDTSFYVWTMQLGGGSPWCAMNSRVGFQLILSLIQLDFPSPHIVFVADGTVFFFSLPLSSFLFILTILHMIRIINKPLCQNNLGHDTYEQILSQMELSAKKNQVQSLINNSWGDISQNNSIVGYCVIFKN